MSLSPCSQTSGYDDGTQRDSRSRPRWGERNRDRGERDDKEGERPFRPPRSNRGGFRGGKREFERRSGSDKTSVKIVLFVSFYMNVNSLIYDIVFKNSLQLSLSSA